MKSLTNRQREVLSFINWYIGKHKYAPSIRELAEHFSISLRGGYDHLKALEKKGFVRCTGGKSRALEVLEHDLSDRPLQMIRIPILGKIAAGKPVFAQENFEGTVGVSSELLGDGEYFALSVRGDSMCNAGIIDGDLAIVHRQQVANNGDIVVAMIEEEATLKRFFSEPNRLRLQAENPAYPPIFTQNLRILGKLQAIQRIY